MTQNLRKIMGLALGMMALSVTIESHACTSFVIGTNDSNYIYGRSLEFALNLNSALMIIPRNYQLQGTGPNGQTNGLKWISKYAATGANAFGLNILLDGVNEKGLTGGMFNFPAYAQFQNVSPQDANKSIAGFELLTYILTNFANVDEVRANLPKLLVNNAKLKQFDNTTPQLHVSLHDMQGKHLVIEYTEGGKLHMYDNPTTVMTNAPTFDWHLKNLSLYQNMTPNALPPVKAGSEVLNPPSTGTSMTGIAGDMSSPSRFIRAYFYSSSAPQNLATADAMKVAAHIINNFDIPPGTVRTSAAEKAGGGINGYETTEWTAIVDMKNARYYIRTFDNSNYRFIDLSKADLSNSKILYFPLNQQEIFTNLMS